MKQINTYLCLMFLVPNFCMSQNSKKDTLVVASGEPKAIKKNIYAYLEPLLIDTIQRDDTFYLMEMSLEKSMLQLEKENIASNKIIFKVFYNEDGPILSKGLHYVPATNEISFFYAKNTQTMFFMFGDDLRTIYLKKEFDQLIKIVEILEHKVFSAISFSGMKVYSTLENYK